MFGGVSIIGAVFFSICMKETKGLTDKQKKFLYSSENQTEEPLSEIESPQMLEELDDTNFRIEV